MKPINASKPPHHTDAWSEKSTTGCGDGCDISYNPAPRIRSPFTSSEIPMKNQMEIIRALRLPKVDIQDEENNGDHASPKKRLLINRHIPDGRHFGQTVHQAVQFAIRFWLRRQTHNNGHKHANQE